MLNSEHSKEAVAERENLKKQNATLLDELLKLKSAPPTSNGSTVQHDEPTEPEDPTDDGLDDEPLPPIDFETYSHAKAEQRRQAEHADYGLDDFEAMGETADGMTIVKPTLRRNPLAELVEYEKLWRRDEEARKARIPPKRRSTAARALFGKATTRSKHGDGAEVRPQITNTFWDKVKRHLSTPKQSVFK